MSSSTPNNKRKHLIFSLDPSNQRTLKNAQAFISRHLKKQREIYIFTHYPESNASFFYEITQYLGRQTLKDTLADLSISNYKQQWLVCVEDSLSQFKEADAAGRDWHEDMKEELFAQIYIPKRNLSHAPTYAWRT